MTRDARTLRIIKEDGDSAWATEYSVEIVVGIDSVIMEARADSIDASSYELEAGQHPNQLITEWGYYDAIETNDDELREEIEELDIQHMPRIEKIDEAKA